MRPGPRYDPGSVRGGSATRGREAGTRLPARCLVAGTRVRAKTSSVVMELLRPPSSLVCYRLVASLAAALIATACAAPASMPTPTRTRTPQQARNPRPSASPARQWLATATARPTARPTSTATATATATGQSQPIAVGIGLPEAEQEVLSWLDPSREPRVEWSRYVRRRDLESALGGETTIDAWDAAIDRVPWSALVVCPSMISSTGNLGRARRGRPCYPMTGSAQLRQPREDP